ncbi:class I SAM-dependent methyltransferase [Actinoplanes sp. NPDC051494]|uniref:class I SAM-dependent methyltransferase n=1 Tax=Actinoplanes sp. NPDC051494 TaxID=3363907 RepID=UPI0037A13616
MSEDHWSEVAADWAAAWGGFGEPAWHAVLAASGAGPGTRVLDVGCGSGDFLAYAGKHGLLTSGADPAPGMLALARPRADEVREAGASSLPWPDSTFDLVTAFNSLQFAEDIDDGLAEMARVTRPGGHIAVANWAERSLNDLDALDRVLRDDPPLDALPPDALPTDALPTDGGADGDLRAAGGLEELLTDGGLVVVAAGLVAVPWLVAGDDALVRGILLGEDPALAPEVIAAATAFREEGGGYRFINHFRFAVGRTSAGS